MHFLHFFKGFNISIKFFFYTYIDFFVRKHFWVILAAKFSYEWVLKLSFVLNGLGQPSC
jgi:hypothetical protein